jgi:hypothetical protein
MMEKLKLGAPPIAAAAADSDESDEDAEITMSVTVGADAGDSDSASGCSGDEDNDVVQSSTMGTIGGWGNALLSEKDKSAAVCHPALPTGIPAVSNTSAASDDDSIHSSLDGSDESEEDKAVTTGCVDTSAGIPQGMTKAEWKQKVKEERREKRKTKIPVRCRLPFTQFAFEFSL